MTDLGFESGNLPTMIFPANEGLTFLPKSCCFLGGLVILLGTSSIILGITSFIPKIFSAVLLRLAPTDPGQPLQPS